MRTTALGVIEDLDREIFAESPRVDTSGRLWWIATEGADALAFAGLRVDGTTAYLSRAGVLPSVRGLGIHQRMIRARVRKARDLGCDRVLTYTMAHNAKSGNNLIRAGFRLWTPSRSWFVRDSDVVYWILRLDGRRGT